MQFGRPGLIGHHDGQQGSLGQIPNTWEEVGRKKFIACGMHAGRWDVQTTDHVAIE